MVNSDEIHTIMGLLAFHLHDTHGIPEESFRNHVVKDGFIQLRILLVYLIKHKDFVKKYLDKDWRLKGD